MECEDMANAAARVLLTHGKQLTKLKRNDKRPTSTNWRQRKFADDEIFKHKGNIGWVLGHGDLVIDVDPRNGGELSFERLKQELSGSVDLVPTVTTAGGGWHVYLSIPAGAISGGTKLRKHLKSYPGIDFLTAGAQCVCVGSEVNGGRYEWSGDQGEYSQPSAPKALLKLLMGEARKENNSVPSLDNGAQDLGDFAGLLPTGADSPEHVSAMLDKLSPDMPNDEWVRVGMALHGWDAVDGLTLWEDWSKGGDSYQSGECAKRWKSFDDGGESSVTLGTLGFMAKEADHDALRSQTDHLLSEMSAASESELMAGVIPKCAKVLGGSGAEKSSAFLICKTLLTKGLQDRLKALGIPMSAPDVRAMVLKAKGGAGGAGPSGAPRGELDTGAIAPSWCDEWVYVNDFVALFNLKNRTIYKEASFNAKCGQHVPSGERGGKPSALKFVSDGGFIEHVESAAYLPFRSEVICEERMGGASGGSGGIRRVVNTYNHDSRPVPAAEGPTTSEEGAALVLIKRHIVDVICNGDVGVGEMLMGWIAWQVQRPGEKLLWSPLIQSIQGVGKSFLGELMRGCLGAANVGVVQPVQVSGNFNGWASGVCVNVLEELKIAGMNRHGAANALKSLVSDSYIQINEKGVKPYMTLNTTNYICFTNYIDAVPMDDADRRWFVVLCGVQSLDEIGGRMGFGNSDSYFDALWKCLREPMLMKGVHRWLLDYPISEAFLAAKTAPKTAGKLQVISTEKATSGGSEWLQEAEDLIEKCTNDGVEFVTKRAICSSTFFDLMLFEHPDFDLKSTQRNRLLKRAGYRLHPKVLKISGKSRRIWTRTNLDSNEIRMELLAI